MRLDTFRLFETNDIKYHQDAIRDVFQDVIDDYDIEQVDSFKHNRYSYNETTYNISKVFSENCIRLVFLFTGEGMVGINYFNGKGIPKEFYTKIHNDIKRLESIGYLVNVEETGMNPNGRWIQIFIRYTT